MYSIYESNHDDTWRFVLGSPGARPLFSIGVNPHAATRTMSDRTVSRVEDVARRNGYDGFIMFNVYPIRSKTVKELLSRPDEVAISQNLSAVERNLANYWTPTIWAAWGSDIGHHAFLWTTVQSLITRLSILKPNWLHYGALIKHGHPRHPSRVANTWGFNVFNVSTYCKRERPVG